MTSVNTYPIITVRICNIGPKYLPYPHTPFAISRILTSASRNAVHMTDLFDLTLPVYYLYTQDKRKMLL